MGELIIGKKVKIDRRNKIDSIKKQISAEKKELESLYCVAMKAQLRGINIEKHKKDIKKKVKKIKDLNNDLEGI